MAPNSSHLNPGFKVVSQASSWRRMYLLPLLRAYNSAMEMPARNPA